MRLIGHLENATLAERVSGLLLAEGIHNQVEPDEGPRWALWVHAEEDLERARQVLAAFRENPNAPAHVVPGRARPAPEGAKDRAERPRRRARTESLAEPEDHGWFGVTITLVLLCGIVAAMTQLGDHPLVRRLQISEILFRSGQWELFLPEVRRGEVWRLFTPMLLHFGWPHLLFNLWAFWDLGRMIEMRRGSVRLLGMVAMLGLVSNLGQYFASGPRFGGMSGVIYGLLGYAWMMGRFRPSAGIVLHPQTVVLMLVWFFVCLSGALGVPVANTAHGIGLAAGMAWGIWAAFRHRG